MTPNPRRRTRKRQKDGSTLGAFERLLLSTLGRPQHYSFTLFVTGTSPRSVRAIASIRTLCETYIQGGYDLEVVDLYQQPAQAAGEQILAAPTLLKRRPRPIQRLVGDLSDRVKVLNALNLQPLSVTNGKHSPRTKPTL